MNKVFIIAEAGTAHEGSLEIALAMISDAYKAKANAIKFQIYKAEEIVDKKDKLYDFFKAREFGWSDWRRLKDHADNIGIEFMASVFGEWSIDVYKRLDGKTWKVASRSQRDYGLICEGLDHGADIIISTGMDKGHMEDYISELVNQVESHSEESPQDEEYLREHITILHCVSKYPVPDEEANLKKVGNMLRVFDNIGYSDHTIGDVAVLGAVALGATVIEKHLNHWETSPTHPDYKCGLNVIQFKLMVEEIRRLEVMNG